MVEQACRGLLLVLEMEQMTHDSLLADNECARPWSRVNRA